jgi:hypothetical protein
MHPKSKSAVQFLKRIRARKIYLRIKSILEWNLKYKQSLVKFENRHKGENCFIIGNGPSLNQMDLSKLKNCTCFGLNKIHMHPDVDKFGVDYLVAVNSLVIKQSFDEFSLLNCPTFLAFRESVGQNIKNSSYNYLLTGGRLKFSPNPYSSISIGDTVTYVALQLAYFMGFTNVFVIGMDHKFVADGEPHEKQFLKGSDPNHFHPDYFGGEEWHLPDLSGSEIAYQLAKNYYEQDDRNIYDSTIGGNLNVFPKIEFEQAVALCQSKQESI